MIIIIIIIVIILGSNIALLPVKFDTPWAFILLLPGL